MKVLQRFGQGLPNTLLITGLTAIIGLISGILLARTLSPFERGEFAAVLLWPGILALLGEFGLGFAFSFYIGRQKDQIDGLWSLAWSVSLIWGSLLAIVGFFSIPLMINLSEEAILCLKLNLLTVPISLLTGYSCYLLLGSKYVFEYNIARFFNAALYTFCIIIIALMEYSSVKIYTMIFILAQIVTCLVSIHLIFSRLKPKFKWQLYLIRPVFTYGGKAHLSSMAAQMNLRLDQLLMTSWISVAQLGFYAIAVSFSSLIMPLFSALSIVTLPSVTQSGDLKTSCQHLIRYFKIGLVIGIPAIILGIVSTPWLLPYLFGMQYLQSVILAQILLVAVLFQGSNIILANGLRGLGHSGKPAISEGVGLIVNIILLALLLPRLGPLGAALASLIAYALVAFVQIFFVVRIAALNGQKII